jgi:hypothetical protein
VGISFNAASLLNGNGINVNSVVSELQSAGSAQLTGWQQDQANLQTQQGLLTSINSDLSSLASAVHALSDPVGALSAVSATSSYNGILTATAQSGATAGNYNVVVSSLATTGTLYTASVVNANTSILPSGATSGDLSIQVGGSGGTTANVAITAGSNDTLTTLAASINSQSTANKWGITASVVTDASGARLAIYSQSSGSPGALAVPDTLATLRQVNDYLRAALLGLRPEERHCSTVTAQEFLDLLTQFRRADACLRHPPARSESSPLEQELVECRANLGELKRFLPDLHARLLVEKARLEGAQAHVSIATAWARASGKAL